LAARGVPDVGAAGNFRQGVPTSVDALLMRALASEPEHRFPDAVAMGAELARLKAKLTPNVGDADVARLLESAFPREKVAEEKALQELLREDASRTRTEQELAAVLTPPNALAFEHSGIDTPEGFVPAERAGDEAPGTASAPSVHGASGAERGAPGMTAMFGVGMRASETAITEALEASKVPAARAHGADAVATEALEASKVSAARTHGADAVATEALEASKVLVAIAHAEAARASGPSQMYPGKEDTVTPVMSPRATAPKVVPPRPVTREMQVGFGVDISQPVDAASVEARRMKLVRAITGEDEAAVSAPRPGTRGRRVLLAAGIFAGACAVGLGVAWALMPP
ncbi:serine/threonine protein kinase, partial [Pyxidicoccus sp. 3LFB2]